MPSYIKCKICSGGGKVMGGGMMPNDCEYCEGTGKVLFEDNEIKYLEMKKSEGYQSAKKRLTGKNKDLTDEVAESMLDEELRKEIK